LRLTVVLLAAGLVLVLVGTLAQVHEGLYQAQARYFKSWLVWRPTIGDSAWPIVLPGGYLIGSLLLLNLLGAHATRFKLTKKKIGILMIHAGIVLLLVGQMLTDLLARESYMQLSTEGPAKYYSESSMRNELAVIDVTDPASDEVVAIPESRLRDQGEIRDSKLPFGIRVREYLPNSLPRLLAPMAGQARSDHQGIGRFVAFAGQPLTAKSDSRNIPAATLEILGGKEPPGVWEVSNWLSERSLVKEIQQESGGALKGLLGAPQEFHFDGRTYQLALRPARVYQPFRVQLLQFTHAVYRGTDIPKDFTSRIRLCNPQTGEDREVKIYMNNPLRYAGITYYQGSYDPKDPRVSILQVVKNPGWLTPYLSCALVALGLIVQFLTHLLGFAAKSRIA
jgi:hypothetical protein